jgi:ComF family protein
MSFFDTISVAALRNSIKTTLSMSHCSFCNVAKTETGICEPCYSAIKSEKTTCQRCASDLKDPAIDLNKPVECGQCLKKPPTYQKVISATRYKYPVDKALGELKFNKQLHYARSLSHVLEQTVRQQYQDQPYPQALVAIPLHPKRLKERGFNQSEIIAKQLSRSLAIPQTNALTRIKDTPHQIGLSEKQRRKNLANAFYLQQSLPEHIALVDDVVTTGSTVEEAAKLCRKQGAKQVDVWCLAKT